MARKQFLALALALGGFAVQAFVPGVASADGGGLLGGLTDTITNVTTDTQQTVGQTLENVTNPQNQNEDAAAQDELLPSVTQSVAETLAPVTETVGRTLEPLTQSTSDTLAPVTQAVAEDAAPATEQLAPLTDHVGPVVQPFIDAAAPVVEAVAPALTPITQGTGELLQPVAEGLQPVLEPVREVIEPLVEPIMEAVEPVIAPIADLTQPIIEPIVEIIEPVTDPLVELIDPVVEPIHDIVSPVVDPVVDPVTPDPIVEVDPPAVTPGANTDPISGVVPGAPEPSRAFTLGELAGVTPSLFGNEATYEGGAESALPSDLAGGALIDGLDLLGLPSFALEWDPQPVLGGPVGLSTDGPALSVPAAPRAPLDAPSDSSAVQVTPVSSPGSGHSIPRFDWPPASLPAGLLGLFAVGALLLLAVTEASPRTWQFRPYTPPA